MNRRPEGASRGSDLAAETAPYRMRTPVDETQSSRQGATAPQPKLESDEADAVSGDELDAAWAGLTQALRAADEDFDAAAAYARLSRTLPPELVALPLVEATPVRRTVGRDREMRNLALGLIAMGAVCAGLAGLAVFGPDFERRTRPSHDPVERAAASPRTGELSPGAGEVSPGAGEVWADPRWEEGLLALVRELHVERQKARDVRREASGRTDEELRRLEYDFADVDLDFRRQSGF